MTNIANLELCQQLYELSNWSNQLNHGNWYYVGRTDPILMLIHYDNDEGGLIGDSYSYRKEDIIEAGYIPAYHLGYLIRKLPHKQGSVPLELHRLKTVDTWEIGYAWHGLWAKADTPENATAQLCIELFKQGILKPDRQSISKKEEGIR